MLNRQKNILQIRAKQGEKIYTSWKWVIFLSWISIIFGDILPALFAAVFFRVDILHLLLFSKCEISTIGSEILDLLLQASLPCLVIKMWWKNYDIFGFKIVIYYIDFILITILLNVHRILIICWFIFLWSNHFWCHF